MLPTRGCRDTMGKLRKRIKHLANAVFPPKRENEENLEEALFNIVKALKKEEKRILKASYPRLKTPLDNQIARLRAQKFPPPEEKK